ncbi:MAG: MTH1187 family thiamine-binding protein [Chlorobium sp.]|uniref:MTH1187 family thiamine-binding protein n=1 Tax=Chlorobium sp. TaxID=1095 RepID=UPI0025B833CE|nr:MTH1187 family thiamine-binding protein [Chlorobium sp.]MCF8216199.1 MTH1187 family thiamine-binding protein [Chlorobium sp.]MCF8271062.1 MTH1187 family thiamine-binding protein [Chlorobium sp.]MCF8287475.1 MTH1187 family thiamine-binding protein [Chlorobium sp.]MCF8290975.1 MTH1187 family thiamine-binding protein [Chlorobium sp.]MCF8385070.1 MTH1187 family thiamine-binding protein [Chlorobium sp.]
MAILDITVIPLDGRSSGFSDFVAGLQELLAGSGCSYRLHDMGTTVEGSASELFALAGRLHEEAFGTGARRVYTVMKIDDRRDRQVRLGDKIASVQAKIADSRE